MDCTRKDATVESVAQNMKERMERLGMLGEGRKNGALLVVDERPPVGDNTTVMLHVVNDAAVKGHVPAAYFSPGELSNVQVVNRLIAINTGIGIQTITDGTLSREQWKKLDAELPKLMGAPLYVDDTPEPTLGDLSAKIAGLARDKGVRLVVVNPVNMIMGDGQKFDDAQDRTDHVTAGLKTLAEDLGITVIAVAE
jgi:replicative DNA helicase